MRIGTKFAGLLVLWSVILISCLVTWLIMNNTEETQRIWQYLPAIITAILGPAGLNLGINEIRKALENGGLRIFQVKDDPEKDK